MTLWGYVLRMGLTPKLGILDSIKKSFRGIAEGSPFHIFQFRLSIGLIEMVQFISNTPDSIKLRNREERAFTSL